MRSPADFAAFLEAYGRRYPPCLTLDAAGDVRQWQRRFRAAVDSLRGPVPERVDLRPEVLEETVLADHRRLLVRVAVSDLISLPAYVLLPAGLAPGERRAGLVALHGHVRYGMESICGVRGMDEGDLARRAYGLAAVRAGYVVVAPAWWGWPQRDGHLERVGTRDRCNVIQMAAAMYGLNVLDLHIQDGQAAVDLLAGLDAVDAARIGCLGNSYGGRTAMWLTLFEPRIRACVPAGCMNTFRERSAKLASCGIQYLPGLLRYGDVPEVFALIAPRPMQLQAGNGDGLITPADRDAMLASLRRVYAACGRPDHLDYVLHDQGHMLVWDEALPFLNRHLGAPPDGDRGAIP